MRKVSCPMLRAIAGNAAGMVLNFGQLNAEELLLKWHSHIQA